MQLIYTESLKLLLEPEVKRLVLQCQGDINSEQYKSGFRLAVQKARDHEVKSWLIDFRLVVQIPEETQSWIQMEIFPQLMSALGTGNYLAFVVSQQQYAHMLGQYGTAGLRSYNCFIIFNTFCETEPAVAWLEANAGSVK